MIIFRVAAPKGVGKTNLLSELIRQLSAEGYEVAAVKHTPKGFSLDVKGKDTWRLAEAGARVVVALGDEAFVRLRGLGLHELLGLLEQRVDIVFLEGFSELELEGVVDLPLEASSAVQRVKRLLGEIERPGVEVRLNGKPLKLNRFVRELLAKTLVAFLSCLKGFERPREILIKLRP